MSLQAATLDINKEFSSLVSGIEELEDLQAPGWGFWAGVTLGSIFVGGIIAGLAVT
jgi:hypothetical protein